MTPSTLSDECQQVLAGVSAYLDGDLDASECEAVEKHGLTCPHCSALVAGLRETVGLCRQVGAVALPDAVRARAQASVRRLLQSGSPRIP